MTDKSSILKSVSVPFICGSIFLLGLLLLQVGQIYFDLEPNPMPMLYGRNFLSSLGVLLMAGAPLSMGLYWLSRNGVDDFSQAVFVTAAIVGLHYIHSTYNNTPTGNWTGHYLHAEYIRRHWLNPYAYRGDQHHHPPLYYYASAVAIAMAQALKTIPVLTAVRFLSWLAYLAFNAFGLLTLRRSGLSGSNYRTCSALLLLWPAGMHFSGKIINDVLFYPAYAAAFYYALVWYQEGGQRRLMAAMCVAGLALMIKSNAVLVFLLIALFMLIAWRRGRFDFRTLYSRQWAAVSAWLAVCILVNSERLLVWRFKPGALSSHWGYNGGPRFPVTAGHFLTYNYGYSLNHPFIDWSWETTSFWDYLLKSFIFDDHQKWVWQPLAVLLDAVLFFIMLYTLLPWLVARRSEWRGMLPFALGLALPIGSLMGFAIWKGNAPNQDARYIYPCIVCLIVFFGHSHALIKARGAMLLSSIGPLLAWSFIFLSVIFYWN